MASPDQPGITGDISYAAYLGKEVQCTVESPLGSMFVISIIVESPFRQGDIVSMQFNAGLARLVAA